MICIWRFVKLDVSLTRTTLLNDNQIHFKSIIGDTYQYTNKNRSKSSQCSVINKQINTCILSIIVWFQTESGFYFGVYNRTSRSDISHMEDGSCSLNLGSWSEDTRSVTTRKRTRTIPNNTKHIRMSFTQCGEIGLAKTLKKQSLALVAGYYPCKWLQTQLVFSGIYCSWEIIWTALSRMWYSMWNDSFENFMETQFHQESIIYRDLDVYIINMLSYFIKLYNELNKITKETFESPSSHLLIPLAYVLISLNWDTYRC